mmetsp:Transcript_27171/g.64667  ORF Transcript_27171/g.64667 Transcript_27171/m.64667 type:complete len:211 (-) Transcript_27171:338-970(-)
MWKWVSGMAPIAKKLMLRMAAKDRPRQRDSFSASSEISSQSASPRLTTPSSISLIFFRVKAAARYSSVTKTKAPGTTSSDMPGEAAKGSESWSDARVATMAKPAQWATSPPQHFMAVSRWFQSSSSSTRSCSVSASWGSFASSPKAPLKAAVTSCEARNHMTARQRSKATVPQAPTAIPEKMKRLAHWLTTSDARTAMKMQADSVRMFQL